MASYTQLNAKTMATIVTDSTVSGISKEQKWVLKAHLESRGKNPFTKFTSGYKGGKPIIEVAETHKLAGDTINLHRLACLAGPGKQGETARDGGEEAYRYQNWQFTIGRFWNGTGQNTVARDQTVIGSNFDENANKMLGEWMGWKKAMDIEYAMRVAAHSRNTIRPNNKSTREALRSADYINGDTVVRSGNALASLSGKSLVMAKSKSGHEIPGYLVISTQHALAPFKSSSTYTGIMANAQTRGDGNELFAGGLPNWNGHGLWEWNVEDHTGRGPVGAACLPRAFLGVAITTATSAQDITGGGDATGGALTTPLYFQHFSGALYTGFEGSKQAAVTNVDRYVAIMNLSGSDAGKIGFYNYRVNNGNKLTMLLRLGPAIAGIQHTTVGNVVYDTAPWTVAASGSYAGWTDAHPEGSLIVECNSYGVPVGNSYMMADEALMSGYGSIDGKVAFGNRTEAKGPHGLDYAVGLECCWGVKAIPRVDSLAGGYVLIEHSIPIPGFPEVAG